MRILLANDGCGDAGGVQTYLDSIACGLSLRGHTLAFFHYGLRPPTGYTGALAQVEHFGVKQDGADEVFSAARKWRPDLVYSQNMAHLDLERRLLDTWPVVKFMHGYFGTCVSGHKMFAFPKAQPCGRQFGLGCLLHYLPRRCGQASISVMLRQFQWAKAQKALFARYRAIVVASRHMREEYVRNGAPAQNVHANPLFAGDTSDLVTSSARDLPDRPSVLFVGRMTKLKGGDLLVRAVAQASKHLDRSVHLVMVGDGPQRLKWQALASKLEVDADFPGWLTTGACQDQMRSASVLAVPSVWPEPFGLVGLEAACVGVPAVAFDVGGIRDWLEDGENGLLVDGRRPEPDHFAQALVHILGNRDRLALMGAKAQASAMKMTLAAHLDRLELTLDTARTISI